MNHIISMNIRGLGDAPKSHCLREILHSGDPIIFLAQETLCARDKAIKLFLSLKSGWKAAVVDADGHSGGLIAVWNPVMASFKAYKFIGGIPLARNIRSYKETVYIINLYASYRNRLSF